MADKKVPFKGLTAIRDELVARIDGVEKKFEAALAGKEPPAPKDPPADPPKKEKETETPVVEETGNFFDGLAEQIFGKGE